MTLDEFTERLTSYNLHKGDMVRIAVKTYNGRTIHRVAIVKYFYRGYLEVIQKNRDLSILYTKIQEIEVIERMVDLIGGDTR